AKQVYQPADRGGGIAPLGLWGLILVLSLITGGLWYYLRSPRAPEDRGTPREKLTLAAILLVLFVAKVWAAPYFGFDTDLGTYKAWGLRLAEVGPADFYAPNYFCDYPPGYLYILWIIGAVFRVLGISSAGALSTIIIKLPAFVADLFSSWLLYVLLRPR